MAAKPVSSKGKHPLRATHLRLRRLGEAQKTSRAIVVAQVNHWDRISPSVKGFLARSERQAFVIVGPREVSQEKVAHRHGESLFQVSGQRLVRKVSEAASDSLLEGIRVGSLAQHIDVVVGLQKDRVGAPKRFFHFWGDVADVGDMRKPNSSLPDSETHRLRRIMRCREDIDRKLVELEAPVRLQANPFDVFELPVGPALESVECPLGGEERRPVPAGKLQCAAGVILVFVGEQETANRRRWNAERRQASFDFAASESDVDEQAHRAARDERDVTATAAP